MQSPSECPQCKMKQGWIEPMISHAQEFTNMNITTRLSYGSAYNFFTRDFLDWAFRNTTARAFLNWSKLKISYSPDEFVWATLERFPGAPGAALVDNKKKRSVKMSRIIKWSSYNSCIGPRERNWICVFGIRDIPYLLSNKNYIANKFDDDGDDLILQCLEYMIYKKTVNEKSKSNLHESIRR